MPPSPARRYADWCRRHAVAITVASLLLLGGSAYLTAFHLPLRADFSHLLPRDAPSVRDLRKLEERVSAQDTLIVLVKTEDRAQRATVAAALRAEILALPDRLVSRVEADDAETRAFFGKHRHLFVPLADLEDARDALADRIKAAKLAANPFYIDIDDEDDDADAPRQTLDALRQRRATAEARLERSGYVSAEGDLQLIVIRTAFSKSDVEHGHELMDRLEAIRGAMLRDHPGVEIGLTMGVATTVAEHDALVRGMVMSSVLTGLLVALLLALYFRSIKLLIFVTATLIVGTAAAFGVAAITVGQLNAATAFLGAIIAGNGVNYGILLIARYLEERRRHDPDEAMAIALQATLRPTIVASLGASIAYGSLAATSFRGFADFAVIGGVGMILCWIVSYTLLPALVLRWGRNTFISDGAPVIGSVLARLFGFRRAGIVVAVSGVIAIAAGLVSWRFIASDPFEYDMKKLRSYGDAAIEARRWQQLSDDAFGRGISGQTFIAADDPEQIPLIVAALRALDDGVPEERRTIGVIHSILEVIPEDQGEKIEVLDDINEMLAEPNTIAAIEELPDDERAEIEALRPPDEPKEIDTPDLPEELAAKLRERNGSIGLMVGVRPDLHLDEWDGRDLIRFANAIRRLELPDGEVMTTSGTQVVYADIIATIQADGPIVIAVAGACLVLMVLIVVGRNLRAVAVLVATALGSVLLIAVCALADIKVTFLDFVALPITLGLGVDYAINVAHRHHKGGDSYAADTLRTSGAAVLLCSMTTMIGYGSLLVSENMAIHGFGLASLIGEICCVLTALVLVPAIVSLRRPRNDEEPPVTA